MRKASIFTRRWDSNVGLVTGDPGALQEVVWDLLAHAVRVSDPGSRVEVCLERLGNEVAVRVTDTSANSERETMDAGGIGTGAGAGAGARAGAGKADATDAGRPMDLRAMAHVLEDHHGRLAVEASGGGGTSYTAALPVRAVSAPEAAEALPAPEGARLPAVGEGFSLAGRRLIVVDDDEDARETLGLLLRAYGAEVNAFGDGRGAYEHLRAAPGQDWPDLMICDIGLPDEDGYTLLRRIRSLEAERRTALAERMPAIALTGYARSEDRVRALVAGFQAHLAKPARPEALLAAIRRLLGEGDAALRARI